MKKTLLLALFVLLCTNSLFSQWSVTRVATDFTLKTKMVNSLTGYSVGTEILKTIDGGAHWSSCYTYVEPAVFSDIDFVGNAIYATGESGEGHNALMVRSTDAGATWAIMPIPMLYFLNHVHCRSEREIFALGGDGAVVMTTDGGAEWFISAYVHNVAYLSGFTEHNGQLYVLDSWNSGWRSADGISWISLPDLPFRCSDLKSFNGKLYACGNDTSSDGKGIYSVSSDDGQTWTNHFIYQPAWINSIVFVNANLWCAVGLDLNDTNHLPNGTVYVSTNAGANWNVALKLDSTGLEDITCNEQYVFATGFKMLSGDTLYATAGTIARHPLSTLAVHEHTMALPTFTLKQNYPNPFNPTTKISYTLVQRGKVRLAVYDIQGREVSVLTDRSEEAGEHVVEFSGATLTSGTYFYKLQTDTYSETKKMMLVK